MMIDGGRRGRERGREGVKKIKIFFVLADEKATGELNGRIIKWGNSATFHVNKED